MPVVFILSPDAYPQSDKYGLTGNKFKFLALGQADWLTTRSLSDAAELPLTHILAQKTRERAGAYGEATCRLPTVANYGAYSALPT